MTSVGNLGIQGTKSCAGIFVGFICIVLVGGTFCPSPSNFPCSNPCNFTQLTGGVVLIYAGLRLHSVILNDFSPFLPPGFLQVWEWLVVIGSLNSAVPLLAVPALLVRTRTSRVVMLTFCSGVLGGSFVYTLISGTDIAMDGQNTFWMDTVQQRMWTTLKKVSHMEAWTRVQHDLCCCGVNSPDDWIRNSSISGIPACCVCDGHDESQNSHCQCDRDAHHQHGNKTDVFDGGCLQAVKSLVLSEADLAHKIVLSVAALQLLGFAYCGWMA